MSRSGLKFVKYTELSKMKTKHQNLCDAAKQSLERELTALHAFTRKEEKSKISHLNLHIRKLKKEEQFKHKTSRENKK